MQASCYAHESVPTRVGAASAKLLVVRLFNDELMFHDLKANGNLDFEGDKQEFSGHKSRLMMELYCRTPDNVQAIDFSTVK